MYSDPIIVDSNDLTSRAYIKTYINGKRYRLYNGYPIGVSCSPNRAKTLKERSKTLQHLCYQFRRKLEKGWTPETVKVVTKNDEIKVNESVTTLITMILRDVDKDDLSSLYKRDIKLVGLHFLIFLKSKKMEGSLILNITPILIEEYLKEFKGSSTYYMNKRRTLAAIFSRIVNKGILDQNPVLKTSRLKEKSLLHEAYTQDQIKTVLKQINDQNKNLYLCALVMYGCLLRPHQEIRLLSRKHFNEDLTKISLGGKDNKSGRIRVVPIPEYVRVELLNQKINELDNSKNIFSKETKPLNESYFNTAWSRIKTMLLQKDIIGKNHTLYSFRHSAAINLYMKTKDLFKIQQAMGHSNMTVTLTYMRSLGQINSITLDDAPELYISIT